MKLESQIIDCDSPQRLANDSVFWFFINSWTDRAVMEIESLKSPRGFDIDL